MLNLTRRNGQRVLIGEVIFSVDRVSRNVAEVSISWPERQEPIRRRLTLNSPVTIGNYGTVYLNSTQRNSARLGFDIHRSIDVVREELVRPVAPKIRAPQYAAAG